jgi:hypothetical protein
MVSRGAFRQYTGKVRQQLLPLSFAIGCTELSSCRNNAAVQTHLDTQAIHDVFQLLVEVLGVKSLKQLVTRGLALSMLVQPSKLLDRSVHSGIDLHSVLVPEPPKVGVRQKLATTVDDEADLLFSSPVIAVAGR